jgi:predicted dehydrogenase
MGQIGLGGGIAPMHLTEMEKNPNFQLVAGCDIKLDDPNVAKQAARVTTAGGKIYPDYQSLLQDPRVEAVCIAVPHFLHRAVTVAAFQAKKHVLCEKPMATHPDECRMMLEARNASGRVGAVQMQHVGRSSMLSLRQAIHSGAIGKIQEIFLSSLWWREESYYGRAAWAGKKMMEGQWNLDGVMFNQAVHFINQALILASPGDLPTVARAENLRTALYRFHDSPSLEMEDTALAQATLATPDRPRLTMVATTCSRQERHMIEILADAGRAVWNGTGYLLPDGQPATEFHDDARDFDGNMRTFNSFARAIRTRSTPITDFSQILKTTDFIFSCYQTAAWNIKKAPWAATENLSAIFGQIARQRALPTELNPRPQWA